MSPTTRLRLARVLLFVTPALWSANYIGARAAAGTIGGHQLALARWGIALLVMLPFAWPELRARWPTWRSEWPQWLVLGGLGMWICGAFVYIGAETTAAVNIGLFYATSPILIALATLRNPDERLSRRQWAGAALALAGVLVILFKGSIAQALALTLTRGDLWIAAAVASWTVYSIGLRDRPSVLGPFARLTLITAGGILVLVPFTIAESVVIGLPAVDARLVMLVLVVALIPGVGAYQAYSFVQRELGASRTALIMYLGPVYAALVAWALLGEQPQWFHLLGAALILPGLHVATRR